MTVRVPRLSERVDAISSFAMNPSPSKAEDENSLSQEGRGGDNGKHYHLGQVSIPCMYINKKPQSPQIYAEHDRVGQQHAQKHRMPTLLAHSERKILVHKKAKCDAEGIVREQRNQVMRSDKD